MINEDSQLKLQAYLDGELTVSEAAQVADWLARDQEAAALVAELQSLKAVLTGTEAEVKVPESREFYWSKIQRQIERESVVAEAAPVQKVSWMAWVQRYMMPLSGAALIVGAVGITALRGDAPTQFGEMEVASDDVGAYTFRDQQAQMTTIWFYDRSQDSQFTDPSAMVSVEPE